MIDFDKVHKISPDYWRNSQLSIARYYGRIKLGGYMYFLDTETDYLVRADILKKEAAEKKKEAKAQRELNKQQQAALL